MANQLVVDVEADVEHVPDEDHGPELQRPRNAGGGLRFTASVCRRRDRSRPRPHRGASPAGARRERPQAPANAERERGDRPAAAVRRGGRRGEPGHDLVRGGRQRQGRERGRAARYGPGSRGPG